MFCQKCGAEYQGNACPNGCGSDIGQKKVKKPIFKKWWFWVIIFVLVIAITAGSQGNDTPNNDTKSPIGGDANTTTTVATEPVDTAYHPGDVIDANGLKITYVKAEKFEESNMFLQPDEGYGYVRLYLSVENTSATDKYISSFEFTCYADGKKEETYYTTEGALEGGTLSSGRKDEGYIYFKVPVAAEKIEVEYETSFWSNKKAILAVDLGN